MEEEKIKYRGHYVTFSLHTKEPLPNRQPACGENQGDHLNHRLSIIEIDFPCLGR
jgi:hypothetical protein